MAVPYDYYRIFYYVAKYRSFTRAAGALQSNQPNVTRTINRLEEELGCRLFQRSRQGVTLTPEGEKLFAHVQIVQEQLQAAEYELSASRSLSSGSISIGTSETALHGLLLPVLRRFHLRYPGVRIQVTNDSTPQAVKTVRSGLVDLAVVATPCPGISKPLAERPLCSFEDILVAGPDQAGLAKEPMTLARLAELPMVSLAPSSSTYTYFSQIFAQQGLAFHPDILVTTTDQVLPMVRYGMGLGFIPELFAREALRSGEVVRLRLAEPIPPRQISLIRDKSRPPSIAVIELERMLCAQSALDCL